MNVGHDYDQDGTSSSVSSASSQSTSCPPSPSPPTPLSDLPFSLWNDQLQARLADFGLLMPSLPRLRSLVAPAPPSAQASQPAPVPDPLTPYAAHVTLLPEEYRRPDLLRARILAITRLPGLSDQHKGMLVQRLMLGRQGQELEESSDSESDLASEAPRIGTCLSQSQRELFHADGVYGCVHYMTGCKQQCPTCKRFYTCRHCHDAAESHITNRKEVLAVACMRCGMVQPPAQECIECDLVFAEYFCEKCKLYDNDANKSVYHCDRCGICRLGLGLGVDYYHCDGCNACISVLLENDHECIEDRTKCDCPICNEFMFTLEKKVVFMACGHAIHQHCYDEYVQRYYKCPICLRTILDMGARFRELDAAIELQPMPDVYASWKCVISCNDCNTKSLCRYHILGLKCDICQSYNTAQLRLIKSDDSTITEKELLEEEEEGIARKLGMGEENTLLKSFFNDTSENDPTKPKEPEDSQPKRKTRKKRGDSVGLKKNRSRSGSQENTYAYRFAANIRNMIDSATNSTNNYYNEFIQAALMSLDEKLVDDEEAFKEGDLITLNKLNTLNIQDFFGKKDAPEQDALDNSFREPVKTGLEDEDKGPSLSEVLRKWANFTAGLSDSDDDEISDIEEEE